MVVAVNDLCILTVVILDNIAVSTLFIVSINLECLNKPSNCPRLFVLNVVIAEFTRALILSLVLVVDLASYLTFTFNCKDVVSGSYIIGVILATLKSFSWVIMSVFFASVNVAPATGLIEIYTRP